MLYIFGFHIAIGLLIYGCAGVHDKIYAMGVNRLQLFFGAIFLWFPVIVATIAIAIVRKFRTE